MRNSSPTSFFSSSTSMPKMAATEMKSQPTLKEKNDARSGGNCGRVNPSPKSTTRDCMVVYTSADRAIRAKLKATVRNILLNPECLFFAVFSGLNGSNISAKRLSTELMRVNRNSTIPPVAGLRPATYTTTKTPAAINTKSSELGIKHHAFPDNLEHYPLRLGDLGITERH